VTPRDRRATAPTVDERWSLWGQGYGGYNTTGGDAAAGTSDVATRTWGLAAGADYRLSSNTTLGFALAGGTMSWGLSDNLGGGKADLFQIGAFASHAFGAGYVSAAASYAWHDMTSDRTVTTVGTEQMTANFRAQNIGGRIETGYRFATPWLGITPYAAAQAQQFRTPSYSETTVSGTGAFALDYDARSVTATRLELGAWFDRTFALDGGSMLTIRTRAAYAHDHTTDNSLTAVFQSLPSSTFVVNGAATPDNLALLSAGAELRLAGNWTVAAKFDGEFASNAQTYTGTGSIRYAW
jgi:outer membrane autotransporter protein